jgi:threonine synthase
VSDDEVVEGIKLLAETEGIFTETAGGVVIAGLRRLVAQRRIQPNELVVAFITGAGLKTQEAVLDRLVPRLVIEPHMASFEEAIAEHREAVAAGRQTNRGEGHG